MNYVMKRAIGTKEFVRQSFNISITSEVETTVKVYVTKAISALLDNVTFTVHPETSTPYAPAWVDTSIDLYCSNYGTGKIEEGDNFWLFKDDYDIDFVYKPSSVVADAQVNYKYTLHGVPQMVAPRYQISIGDYIEVSGKEIQLTIPYSIFTAVLVPSNIKTEIIVSNIKDLD